MSKATALLKKQMLGDTKKDITTTKEWDYWNTIDAADLTNHIANLNRFDKKHINPFFGRLKKAITQWRAQPPATESKVRPPKLRETPTLPSTNTERPDNSADQSHPKP